MFMSKSITYEDMIYRPEDVVYVGAFLNDKVRDMLIAKFDDDLQNKFAHHITLAFKPDQDTLDLMTIGADITIQVIGEAIDNKGHALIVKLPDDVIYKGKTPHITISTADGVKPFYSNILIDNGSSTMLDKPFEFTAKVGAFLNYNGGN
jgi:hypothetical protein